MTPLSVAMARVAKAVGGKRILKKLMGDAYWELQWQIMTEEA